MHYQIDYLADGSAETAHVEAQDAAEAVVTAREQATEEHPGTFELLSVVPAADDTPDPDRD
jgi:hypothetical protein